MPADPAKVLNLESEKTPRAILVLAREHPMSRISPDQLLTQNAAPHPWKNCRDLNPRGYRTRTPFCLGTIHHKMAPCGVQKQ
jgi:hypothetical protein